MYYPTVLEVRSPNIGQGYIPSGDCKGESISLLFLTSEGPLHALAHGSTPPSSKSAVQPLPKSGPSPVLKSSFSDSDPSAFLL